MARFRVHALFNFYTMQEERFWIQKPTHGYKMRSGSRFMRIVEGGELEPVKGFVFSMPKLDDFQVVIEKEDAQEAMADFETWLRTRGWIN